MITYNVSYNLAPMIKGQYPRREETAVDRARLDELARADWVLDGAVATPVGTGEPSYLRLTTTGINPRRRDWVLTMRTRQNS
jgi:hypothetical protein